VVGLVVEATGIDVGLGSLCRITSHSRDRSVLAEVVGFNERSVLLMPLGELDGLHAGASVQPLGRTFGVDVGPGLLGRVLNGLGVTLIKVPMPGYRIHIDGSFMMVDVETAIVNKNELPYVFIDYLVKRGMKLIELPPEDNGFSLNCLAVAPGRLIMHTTTSPRLADRLDQAGISIIEVDYEAVELGGGGIHCSTAPLIRDPI
jgi:hypothetical protein